MTESGKQHDRSKPSPDAALSPYAERIYHLLREAQAPDQAPPGRSPDVEDQRLRQLAHRLAEQNADQWAHLVERGVHPLLADELVEENLVFLQPEDEQYLVNDRPLSQVLAEENPPPELDESPESENQDLAEEAESLPPPPERPSA